MRTAGGTHHAMSSAVPGPWIREAACRGEPDRIFFPERGETLSTAKLICRGCPVREECLEYALRTSQLHGIWGGLSVKERRRIRRRRKTVA